MGEFFRGWRRKLGVLMLVMALLAMGGWMRSLQTQDVAIIPYEQGSSIQLVSACQCLVFVSAYDSFSPASLNQLAWRTDPCKGNHYLLRFPGIHPTMKCRRFRTSEFRHSLSGKVAYCYHLPYWSVVLPLTLLSAYLLLSKPRQSTLNKIAEPLPTEGK